MAATNLFAVHAGKDGSPAEALRRIIGYIDDPKKTNNDDLITAYECEPRLYGTDFLLDKRTYIQRTGRVRGKDDVIAYHLRQSFVPGEITPEEANRLGNELAMRFTKGNHSFIVATHTDKHHLHNHIIFNAVNLDCDRKFRDFQGSKKALARLSDMICLENGYSVIEHPMNKGKKYNKWLGENYRRTHRDELREAIDIALMEKPKNMQELLKLLEAAGWEIKVGKHISFRKPGQQRFKRLESLGEEYSEETLTAVFKGSRAHKPKRNYHGLSRQNERLALLTNIQAKMQKNGSPGYERWSKTYYLKQMAKTVLYMSEHDLDFETLKKETSAKSQRNDELLSQINAIDARLKQISDLKIQITNYIKTKDVYQKYHKHGNSKKFAAEHEQELAMHKAAKQAFDALGLKKLPTIKTLSAEYDQLVADKKRLYAEYRQVHEQMTEMLTVRANMEQMLKQDEALKEQERSRANVR